MSSEFIVQWKGWPVKEDEILWAVALYAVAWSIWLERNKRCFHEDFHSLWSKVSSFISFWYIHCNRNYTHDTFVFDLQSFFSPWEKAGTVVTPLFSRNFLLIDFSKSNPENVKKKKKLSLDTTNNKVRFSIFKKHLPF